MRFELTDAPATADLAQLAGDLTAFNDIDAMPMNRRLLAVFVRDAAGGTLAALSGYTSWNWLFTQLLFVSAAARGQGLAGRMLAMAESEAITRGCHSAWIDTFNPVALKTYQRAGYAVFGELPNFVPGRSRYFLSKALSRQA